MRITALTENTSASADIGAEHGLSLYIEALGKRILFDMGQTTLFADNAKKLGVDLGAVDIAVLSHGHYDHGGGLPHFLSVNSKSPVYVQRNSFGEYYNGTQKYIGLDKSLEGNSRIIYTDDAYDITEGLSLYSHNQSAKAFELGSFGLTVKEGEAFLPDSFSHEQYLLIEENGKRVLISGCSHKGVLNIVNWFKPNVLIGGFHFSSLPMDETLKSYALYLDGFDTTYYTCHCTGVAQYEFMKENMESLYYLSAGQSIEL